MKSQIKARLGRVCLISKKFLLHSIGSRELSNISKWRGESQIYLLA